MNDVATISAPVSGDVEAVNPAPHDPILSAILMAARDPQVDMDKFRALKSMYDEERAYNAEREFSAAMQEAQAEMGPVAHDKLNEQTSSKYATISALAKAITPIYTKHGFAMTFDQGETTRDGHLRVNGELRHRGGHVTRHYADVPIDKTGIAGKVNKTDTHAYGSTMKYGQRYLKLLVWDIATKDDDGNAAGGAPAEDPITEEQAQTLRELVEEIGRTEDMFIAGIVNPFLKRGRLPPIVTLSELPASKFDAALDYLRKKKLAEQGEAANV